MGCCGCSDEPASKVEPTTPEGKDMTRTPQSVRIFSTDRSCTDLVPLLILVVLIGGYAFLVQDAVKRGDIYRVLNGYDDNCNVCGRVTPPDPQYKKKGADMTSKRYLLVTLNSKVVKSRECVANCSQPGSEMVVFLNRCVPKKTTDTIYSVTSKLGLDSFFREATRDLGTAWRELIYLLLIALGFSLAILVAFRFMVQWVVYIVLTGTILASIAGSTYLWLAWFHEKKMVDTGQIAREDSSITAYLTYAIILTTVTVVTLLIVLVMRKRIALVMQLFREAGKAVYSMPALLLQPVYTYLLIGITVCAWVYCMLWIESAGDLYLRNVGSDKQTCHYKKDAMLIATRWYNLFMFFVTCEFLLGCQHMVVACAVARWYFTKNKKQLFLTVTRGFGYLVRYHLGTVAFGALVIGIVRLIRAIISFIQNRLKRYDNDFVKGILWCCQCCLWCFECALKFLTRNAYIETAIYGCGFCTGGKKAFQALSNNILRVAAINSVGDFVLFLGKVLVVTLTVVTGIYLIQPNKDLQHPWVPIAIAGVFAFLVAHSFISVYEMIIDTIFICFCEDCSKNDGIDRPYYMSTGLMEFVENSKAALRNLEGQQAAS